MHIIIKKALKPRSERYWEGIIDNKWAGLLRTDADYIKNIAFVAVRKKILRSQIDNKIEDRGTRLRYQKFVWKYIYENQIKGGINYWKLWE
jgi:hypothetical protein